MYENKSREPFDASKYRTIAQEFINNVEGNDSAGGVCVEAYSYDNAVPRIKVLRWYTDRESNTKKFTNKFSMTGPVAAKVSKVIAKYSEKIIDKYFKNSDSTEEVEETVEV